MATAQRFPLVEINADLILNIIEIFFPGKLVAFSSMGCGMGNKGRVKAQGFLAVGERRTTSCHQGNQGVEWEAWRGHITGAPLYSQILNV